jgi:hypothetical protein|tara:strand:- start:169 stop:384 length:216 start_codon:yes stop_codon:yes gene_type:complete
LEKRSIPSGKIIFMTAALFGFSSSAAYSASYISDSYPTADSFLGEKLQGNELEETILNDMGGNHIDYSHIQ